LRACVAGGDGSVNWVVSLLLRVYTSRFRPPLSVIPFGTGNDMSRALGWGSGMSSRRLRGIGRLIENMAGTDRIALVDVWTVVIHEGSGDPVLRPMVNYISFGVDASAAYDYQRLRAACQPLFCCQCMSTAMFCPAGCLRVFGGRDIASYMSVGLTGFDGEQRKVKPERGEKTLVFQSTPTIYGGSHIWTGRQKPELGDGKLEVLLEGGIVMLLLAHFGINFARSYAQAEAARIEVTEPCCYQIDGEARMTNGPAAFHVVRTGSYPFLFVE
jgi:diacylglycerol kinase (ATP)